MTAVVNAQAYRNQTLPDAEASVLRSVNGARAEGAGDSRQGRGRGLELFARWSRNIAPSPAGIFLPPPPGDA